MLESPRISFTNFLIKDCHGTNDFRVISDKRNDLQLVGFKRSKRFAWLTLRRKLSTSDKDDIEIKVTFCTVASNKNCFLLTSHRVKKEKNFYW